MGNFGTFNKNIISNPNIFKQNRLDPHSAHRYYASSVFSYEDRNNVCEGASGFSRSLNGEWKVFVAKNESLVPCDFYKEDFDVSGFSAINVPAHIQIEGFDKNAYVNYQYPWDGVEDIEPGQIPQEYNPVACYVNYIDIEEIQKECRYRISFDGVESNVVLWINGKYVGYAEDAFTTSEFDITDYIREGSNKIACMVYKWCSSCFIDDQDFFRFSGIFRSVTLRTIPRVHINDIKVLAELDDTYNNGAFSAEVEVIGELESDYSIVYGLFDTSIDSNNMSFSEYDSIIASLYLDKEKESGCVARGEVTSKELQITNGIAKCSFVAEVSSPEKWSAEKPYLYSLVVLVVDNNYEYLNEKSRKIVEISTLKVGFRNFEMIDGIMCINGKRIVFNGVNRHEFSMKTGRAISYEETEQDIINMKKNNINALRTSHYPNSEFVYDLCDKYGLYVICENNMESHGSWANIYAGMTTKERVVPGDNPDFKELLIDRASSMIEKEKNHPSILIWSCGNESFGGSNIWEMSQHMRKLDPTRLIHYEGIFHDRRYPDTSDMETQMYPSVEDIKKHLAENKEKPFICCEYTHAMGNSCGAMYKYTDLTKTEPRYQGGFIWDYIDQALETENVFGEKYLGYGGDFGDRPCDYEFSGDGICYADRSDSPKMSSVKYNYQPMAFEVEEYVPGFDGLMDASPVFYIDVTNLNLFTDFSAYNFNVEIKRNDVLFTDTVNLIEFRKGFEELKPGEKSCISVYIPESYRETEDRLKPGIYTITVKATYKEDNLYAKASEEVAVFQYKKVVEGEPTKTNYTINELDSFKVIEGGYNVGVKGARFSVLFSALNGGITSYVYDGKEYIDIVPRPNFWRAPTDNDRGNQMPFRYAQWKAASTYQLFKDPENPSANPIKIEEGINQVTIIYTYYLPTVVRSSVEVSYTVFPDGKITVHMDYSIPEGIEDMPEFGMLFNLPLELQNLSWLGLGPQETYADRTQGALFGRYQNKVADNFAEYLRPQECGNHMDVYEASITNDKGKGILFAGNGMNFSALPYTPDDIECARHAYELKRPDHTVVRASLAQMGVGGDDTWGAKTHPEFLVVNQVENNYGELIFEFSFKGI